MSRVLDPAYWQTAHAVRAGQHIPRLKRRWTRRNEVWAIAMVRNEADIIEAFVEHIFAQDCDRLLIVDNESTDNTLHTLRRLASDYPIIVGTDTEKRYFQAHKMTRLASLAYRAGAGWVVPMDADEFWFAPHGTLGSYLRSTSDDVLRSFLYNAFPTPTQPVVSGPTQRLRINKGPDPTLSKQCARTFPGLWIEMGNHGIRRPGRLADGLSILHLPWRSYDQYRRKVRDGAAALQGTNTSSAMGNHWTNQGELSDLALTNRWQRLLEGHTVPSMGWSPSPEALITDPSSWTSWEDARNALHK